MSFLPEGSNNGHFVLLFAAFRPGSFILGGGMDTG
jgi:hypothetical protein